MKKIFIIITFIFFISCEEKLDITPRASLAPEAITGADSERLLLGIYDAVQTGNTSFFYLSYLTEDLSADNLTYRATFFQHGEVNTNAILANNVLVARYYNGPYAIIRRANDLIGIVEPLPATNFVPNARKNQILAEARYLRAYAYYKLVTLFGGVPITLTPSTENIPRSTEAQVWNQIITDLTFAIANGTPNTASTSRSRVTVNAAKALLSRAHLIRQNWTEAARLAEEVISSSATSNYALQSNYAGIWTNANSPEVIFQVVTTTTEASASHGFFLTEAAPLWPTSGRFELPVDISLINAYETGDKRRDGSTALARVAGAVQLYQAIKFPSGNLGSDPLYVSRLAEMYLISAEAAAERDNNPASGLGRLNELRAIRGTTTTTLPARVATTMADFRTFIQQERRVELAFEGVRWTDLKRSNTAIGNPNLPTITNVNQLLYPIPQAALDVNPLLTQNPGY